MTDADRSTNTERSIQGHSEVQSSAVQNSALNCTALHYIALHYTALHCTALHCTALGPCMLLSVLVLLSASVERFGVSRMRDFLLTFSYLNLVHIRNLLISPCSGPFLVIKKSKSMRI